MSRNTIKQPYVVIAILVFAVSLFISGATARAQLSNPYNPATQACQHQLWATMNACFSVTAGSPPQLAPSGSSPGDSDFAARLKAELHDLHDDMAGCDETEIEINGTYVVWGGPSVCSDKDDAVIIATAGPGADASATADGCTSTAVAAGGNAGSLGVGLPFVHNGGKATSTASNGGHAVAIGGCADASGNGGCATATGLGSNAKADACGGASGPNGGNGGAGNAVATGAGGKAAAKGGNGYARGGEADASANKCVCAIGGDGTGVDENAHGGQATGNSCAGNGLPGEDIKACGGDGGRYTSDETLRGNGGTGGGLAKKPDAFTDYKDGMDGKKVGEVCE